MIVGKIFFAAFGILALIGGISSEDPFWNVVGVLAGFFCLMVAAQDEEGR